MADTTYVVLLNWRGWRDTIACLESVFASRNANYKVIVCDNNSGDGSLEHIQRWADGELTPEQPAHPRLAALLGRTNARITVCKVDRESAERGAVDPKANLILVDNEANLGFAAGNNTGLRLALSQADMECVWLLNNDTLVEPDCLANMRAALRASKRPAVCGSMIHFFDNPEIIQACGGNRFNSFTGVASESVARMAHEKCFTGSEAAQARIDYLSGCSMLLPRRFLEEVGLMCEDYFLYYEEIDWFTRAAERYALVIAHNARLYHREGGSIGSAGWDRPASPLSDFHMIRSRLIYMGRYHRRYLLVSVMRSLLDASKRTLRGHLRNAAAICKAIFTRSSSYA